MEDTDEARFRQRVRALREAFGWTQAELAERVGYTQQAIAKIEKQGPNPQRIRLDDARAFAEALEVPLSDLLAPDPADASELLRLWEPLLEIARAQVAKSEDLIAEIKADLARLEQERTEARRDVARYEIRIGELRSLLSRPTKPPRRKRA